MTAVRPVRFWPWRHLGAALSVSLLAGCAHQPPELPRPQAAADAVRSYVYECEGGYRFLVHFASTQVRLFLPEGSLTLPQVIAASGIRYSDGTVTFWGKGSSALLDLGTRRYSQCGGRPVGDAWEDARLRGVVFRALGNEPGWYLEIGRDGGLLFVTDYGRTRHAFAAARLEREPGAVLYRARAGGQALTARLVDRPCRDDMSGAVFATTVAVTLDGKRYRGCGRALR
ncbi:MliC family protein [Thermithiobacillus tepidarius DSM 3134]|uniref:MliC family protein n=1 Tax=Thermithiobacillus tepidarius TaxID=929 RepID=UPI0003FD2B5C|nr:MliC family protein [Thermithiobacillus tepidarius]